MKATLTFVIQLVFIVRLAGQDVRDLDSARSKDYYDSTVTRILLARAKEIGKVDTSGADKIFRMAIDAAKKGNDFYNAGKAYYEMGEMYFRFRNHNRSFGAFFNAKECFVKSDSKIEIAFSNFTLGRQQYYRGNYKISASHLNFAVLEARKLKLKALEANVLEYMGILYHVMPNRSITSTTLLQRALEIKYGINDEIGALQILKTLGNVYYDEQKFDSSLHFATTSIKLSESLGLGYDANLARLNQVPALLRLNKIDEAQVAISSIRPYLLDTSDVNMSIRYYSQLGNYLVSKKNDPDAAKSYDTAIQIAQSAGFPELYALVYKNMADAYYYADDFEKAYEYHREYTRKMAGLYSADNGAAFGELEYVLKTNITEDEVKYLSAQNEVKELRLKNERSLTTMLLLGVAGLLIAAVAIFILYKKQKTKSVIIEKQAADLQTLMKEIHHRVKNNLQVISSLLDLQSQTIGDEQAAEAIKESRNRVQTMALIHQDLYSEGNVQGIEMPEYINKLAQNLFSSYNVKRNKISLETHVEPMLLDIDLVIPIGFVLNELISNALKYAFPNSESGILNIELHQKEGELILKVTDNGIGFPPGLNIYQAKSFGYKLVKAFAQKLKARLEVYNDNGACVLLHIRKYKINTSA